jgi:uncharacterized protein with PhoU and TrkA domain
MNTLNTQNSLSQSESTISTITAQLDDKERLCTALRDEMASLNSQADSRARLTLRKTEEGRKLTSLGQMTDMIKPYIVQHCGAFNPETVERDMTAVHSRAKDALKTAQESYAKQKCELSVAESSLLQLREEQKGIFA